MRSPSPVLRIAWRQDWLYYLLAITLMTSRPRNRWYSGASLSGARSTSSATYAAWCADGTGMALIDVAAIRSARTAERMGSFIVAAGAGFGVLKNGKGRSRR